MGKGEKEYNQRYYQEHKAYMRARSLAYYRVHKKARNAYKAKWLQMDRKRVKQEVVKHYSGGAGCCSRCNFGDIRALSIDHVAGGGAKHRRVLGLSGYTFYLWLKKQGYPEGYQVLCMNCQFIKKEENKEYAFTSRE